MRHTTAKTRALALALALSCALGAYALAGCTTQPMANSDNNAAKSQELNVETASSNGTADSAGNSSGTSNASATSSSASSAAGDSTLASKLKADLVPIVEESGMDVGVCVIDPQSHARASIHGDKRMVAASMIKLVVAASFLERVDGGEFTLDDACALDEDDIVGGAGTLGGRGAGAEATYGEILELMIAESDNTAANLLINAIGIDAVNDMAKRLDLKSTELNRLMMDEEAIAQGVENYTSANDIAAILDLASRGELVSAKASKTLVSALRKQVDETGILAGLPADVEFAHKTGALSNAQNDGGIVMPTGSPDFVVAVMCGGDGFNLDGALGAMEDVGRIAYQGITGQPSE